MAEGLGVLNHPPPRVGHRRSSQWSRNEWPHLASLYASTHQLDEDGKHPDPMMGQDNVFDPTEPYNAYRYYIQPVARSEFSIEEPTYVNRPMYKDEESRSSDYTSGDSFRRGSTCRVLLCVTLVLSFIGVVVAAITLAVLLSQTPRPAKSAQVQPEVYQSEASMLGQDFNEKLLDKDSEEFKKLSEEFCIAIEQIFTDQDSPVRHEFVGCEVLEFRNGSVEAVFRIKLLPKSKEGFKNEDRLIQEIQKHFAAKIKQAGPWQSVKFNPDFIRRFFKVALEPATTTQAVTNATTTTATTATEQTINTTISVSDSTAPTTSVNETLTTTQAISNATTPPSDQSTTPSIKHVTDTVTDIATDAEVKIVDLSDRVSKEPLIIDSIPTSPAMTSSTESVSTEFPRTTTEEILTATEVVIDIDPANVTRASNASDTDVTMIPLPFDTTDDLGFQNFTDEDMITFVAEQTSPTVFTEGPSTESPDYNATSSSEAPHTTTESVLPLEPYTTEASVGFSTDGQATVQYQTSTQEVLSTDVGQTTLDTGMTTDKPSMTSTEVYEETKPTTTMLKITETAVETSSTMSLTTETGLATQQTHAADTTPSAPDMTTHLVSTIPTTIHMTDSITTDQSLVDGVTTPLPETEIITVTSSHTTTQPDHQITADHHTTEASIFDDTTNATEVTTSSRELTTSQTASETYVTLTNITEIPIDMITDDFNFTDIFQNDTTVSILDIDQTDLSENATSNETSIATEQQPSHTTTEASQFIMKNYTVVETALPVTQDPLQVDISILLENVTQDVPLQTTSGIATGTVTTPTDVSSTPLSAGQTLSTEYQPTSDLPVVDTTMADQTTQHTDGTTQAQSDTTPLETASEAPTSAESPTTHRDALSIQPDTSDTTPVGPTVTDKALELQTTHSQSVLTTYVDSSTPPTSLHQTTFSVEHLPAHTTSLSLTDTGTASNITDMADLIPTTKDARQTTPPTLVLRHATELPLDAETMVHIIPGTDTVTIGHVTETTPQMIAIGTQYTTEITFSTEHAESNVTEELSVTDKQIPVLETTTAPILKADTTAASPHTESATSFETHGGLTVDAATQSVLILTGTDSTPSSGTDSVPIVVDIATSLEGIVTDTTESVNHTVAPTSPASTAEETVTDSVLPIGEAVTGTNDTSVAETHITIDTVTDTPETIPVSIVSDTSAGSFTSQPIEVAPTEPAIIFDGLANETDGQHFTDIMDLSNATESFDVNATTGVTESSNITIKLEPDSVTTGLNFSDTTDTIKAATQTTQPTIVLAHATELPIDVDTMIHITTGTDTVTISNITDTPTVLAIGTPDTTAIPIDHIERNITEEHTVTEKHMPVLDITESPIVTDSPHTTDKPGVKPGIDKVVFSATLKVKDQQEGPIILAKPHEGPIIIAKPETATDSLSIDHTPTIVNTTGTTLDLLTITADQANVTVKDYSNETNITYTTSHPTQNFSQDGLNQTLVETNATVSYTTAIPDTTPLYNGTDSTISSTQSNEFVNENTTGLFDFNNTDIFDLDNVTEAYNATEDPSISDEIVIDGSQTSETVHSNATGSGNDTDTSGFEHSHMHVTTPMSVINTTSPTESQAERTSTASTIR